MNLAFCLFNYFPFGGLQRDFMRIALLCLKRKHRVTVYTMQWEGEKPEGFSIKIIRSMGLSNHQRCSDFSEKLLPILKQAQHDKVIGFNKTLGLDIYYAADVCYQLRMDSRPFWNRLFRRYYIYRFLERAVFSEKSQTLALMLCEKQKQDYLKAYPHAVSRLVVLPPGIDKQRRSQKNREELRKKLGVSTEEKVVLFVGSGFNNKGLDRAINAIASLPAPLKKTGRLVVLGQGRASQYQKQAKAEQVTEQVQFLGGSDAVPDWLLAADLLLHPARLENTGTVLLEAVVAGLPVITTAVCGFSNHIVKAKAGEVMDDPFLQVRLNQVLLDLLSSPEKRQQYKINALDYAAQAELYSMPKRVVECIEQ